MLILLLVVLILLLVVLVLLFVVLVLLLVVLVLLLVFLLLLLLDEEMVVLPKDYWKLDVLLGRCCCFIVVSGYCGIIWVLWYYQ